MSKASEPRRHYLIIQSGVTQRLPSLSISENETDIAERANIEHLLRLRGYFAKNYPHQCRGIQIESQVSSHALYHH